jgi:putative copper export protein
MTAISLTDAAGKKLALGAPEQDPSDPLGISVRITTVIPSGRYTLEWRTAASDGHPTHGSFSFTVLAEAAQVNGLVSPPVTPPAISALQTSSQSPTPANPEEESDAAASVSNSLVRALSFTGLLILIGATTFKTLVLPRARELEATLVRRMEKRAALVGLLASVLVILAAAIRIFLETRMMNEMPGMRTMSMADMTMHTQWGLALQLQLGASLVATISFALAGRRMPGGWMVASIASVVLALTPALVGHAAASAKFTTLAIVSDFLHVIAGASWLGSLFCVMLIGIPIALSLEEGSRWQSIAALVNSFSFVAIGSVSVLVVTGVVASWVHLDRISALWQTPYGQVLLLKLGLVALTLLLGAYNFRRVQPQLVRQEGAARLRKSASLELGFGLLILLVTAWLTGLSP